MDADYKMKLLKLTLHNFKSYDNCELNLSGISACSIIGPMGSGKSSIVEGILWALYGDGKTPNADLCRSGSEYMYVNLDFELNCNIYSIEREYSDGKVELTFRENGEPVAQGNRACSAAILKVMGVSKNLLDESIVIPQGKLSSFIESTPSERRDLVASLLGLDRWNSAWETAKETMKEMTMTLATHDNTIDAITKQVAMIPTHESLDQMMARTKSSLADVTTQIAETSQKRERIMAEDKTKNDTVSQLNAEVTGLSVKLARQERESQDAIEKVESQLRVCTNKEDQLKSMREMLPALQKQLEGDKIIMDEVHQLSMKGETLSNEIKSKRDRMAIIASNTGHICPLCGNEVTPDKWGKILDSMKTEMDAMAKELNDTNNLMGVKKTLVLVPIISTEKRVRETGESIAKIEGQLESRPALVAQLDELKSKKTSAYNELKDQLAIALRKIEGMRSELSSEVVVLDGQIADLTSQQSGLANTLIGLTSSKQNRTSLENALKDEETNIKAFKAKLPETTFVVGALSPTGIPLMITDHYLPVVAAKAQELLHSMSDGQLNMRMDIVESGAKRGIELFVGTDTLRPIKSLSGGESTRVSLAIRIALSQVLQEISGCRFDLLFVDEPPYLDANGVSYFISTINTLREQYPQIFVMSHVDRIKDAFPNSIRVGKENDVSKGEIT